MENVIEKYQHLEGKRVKLKEDTSLTGKVIRIANFPHIGKPGPRLYIRWDYGCSPDGLGHNVLYSDIEGAVERLIFEGYEKEAAE